MAMRSAILRHVRVPVQTLTQNGAKSNQNPWSLFGSVRLMSSHEDHITKEEVIDRVLSVVKCFPKVDPSKLTMALRLTEETISIYGCKDFNLFRSENVKAELFMVTPDVHFQKDLGLDSLDTVEIVMALEEEFKLEIPDKEADKIDSCHLAIEYIHNHPMAS
ncbi:hypothetical protein ACFE04_017790 [Oxalis oulophora]